MRCWDRDRRQCDGRPGTRPRTQQATERLGKLRSVFLQSRRSLPAMAEIGLTSSRVPAVQLGFDELLCVSSNKQGHGSSFAEPLPRLEPRSKPQAVTGCTDRGGSTTDRRVPRSPNSATAFSLSAATSARTRPWPRSTHSPIYSPRRVDAVLAALSHPSVDTLRDERCLQDSPTGPLAGQLAHELPPFRRTQAWIGGLRDQFVSEQCRGFGGIDGWIGAHAHLQMFRQDDAPIQLRPDRFRQDADVLVANTWPPLMRLQYRHISPTGCSPNRRCARWQACSSASNTTASPFCRRSSGAGSSPTPTSTTSASSVGDRARNRAHQPRNVARGSSNRRASARSSTSTVARSARTWPMVATTSSRRKNRKSGNNA